MKTILYMLATGALLTAGCGSQTLSSAPARTLCKDEATVTAVLQAAERVLVRMHFAIEKLDPEHGILRTRPLRGAQLFEFWRSDNVGPFNAAEANLQTIRRSVELRVRAEDGGQRTEDGNESPQDSAVLRLPSGLCIECEVSVQRLSLPGNEIASVSQAYRIHSQSTPTVQRMAVTPEQERAMAWVNLGRDPQLAAEILRRVTQGLETSN